MNLDRSGAQPPGLPAAHPLVTSHSAPTLGTAASTAGGVGRVERPLRDSPSPDAGYLPLSRLHPAIPRIHMPPQVAQESKQESKQESVHGSSQDSKQADPRDARAPARSPAPVGLAPGALVRFVGGFILSPHAALETDNDALTVLAESIQRSAQQQPDSAAPSSAEATPQTQPATPRPPGETD